MSVNQESELIENISNLMKRSFFNDLRITLKNGVQVEANKVILSAMSSFFDRKLHEKLTSDQFLEIEIDISCSKEILDLVIQFFYTGKMIFESLSLKELFDLLCLLQLFESKVFTVVENFTRNQINEDSFSLQDLLMLSRTAEDYNFEEIISSMIKCFKSKIDEVSRLKEVKNLSSNFLKALVHINGEDAKNGLYFTKFEIVTTWLESNKISQDLKTKILSNFDLRNFTNQQLTSTVRKSKLFSDSSILDVLSNSILNLENKFEEQKQMLVTQENQFSLLSQQHLEQIRIKDAKITEQETELSLLAKKHLEQIEIKDAELGRNATELQNQKSKMTLFEIEKKLDKIEVHRMTSSKDIRINQLVNELNQKKEEIAKLQSDYTTLHRAFTRTYGYGH